MKVNYKSLLTLFSIQFVPITIQANNWQMQIIQI